MSATINKRLEALEAHHGERDLVTIICISFLSALPEEQDTEPFSATVGGRLLQREDDESAKAFLARVEAEAKLAAKPGCNAVAVVWPRPESPA